MYEYCELQIIVLQDHLLAIKKVIEAPRWKKSIQTFAAHTVRAYAPHCTVANRNVLEGDFTSSEVFENMLSQALCWCPKAQRLDVLLGPHMVQTGIMRHVGAIPSPETLQKNAATWASQIWGQEANQTVQAARINEMSSMVTRTSSATLGSIQSLTKQFKVHVKGVRALSADRITRAFIQDLSTTHVLLLQTPTLTGHSNIAEFVAVRPQGDIDVLRLWLTGQESQDPRAHIAAANRLLFSMGYSGPFEFNTSLQVL